MARRWIWPLCAAGIVAAALVWRWIRPPTVEVVHPGVGPAVQAVYATGTKTSAMMQDILRRLAREQGRAVVAVTHDRAFARSAGRIIAVVDGRIAQGA